MQNITIQLPDSLEKIKLLINILNTYGWSDHTITVNNTTYHISQEGMNLLQQIK
jgi:hypothetical protein